MISDIKLTDDAVLNMTVRELMDKFMSYDEVRDSIAGTCRTQCFELSFYENEPSSVVSLSFDYMHRPKEDKELKKRVLVILKTE